MVSKYNDIGCWEPKYQDDYEYLNVDKGTTLRCPFDNSNCTWCRNVWGKADNSQPVTFGNMPYDQQPEEIIDDAIPLTLREQPLDNTYEAHLAAMDGHRVEDHPQCKPT